MKYVFSLIDCNNFYASCERVFDPALKNRPIVILSNNDGCVIARSAEAKKIGIPMGAPEFKVRPLIREHNVAVRSSNYALYGDMSQRVMEAIRSVTPDLEVYSIDEAFALVHGGSPPEIQRKGKAIRRRVLKWTGLPVSVGMASSKTLAKIANETAKGNPSAGGVYWLNGQGRTEQCLRTVPVSDIWGVGRRYAWMLEREGIQTAWQLSRQPDHWVRSRMKVTGLRTVWELRGYPCLQMEESTDKRKGILSSRSFGKPVYDIGDLKEAVATFTARSAEKLRAQGSVASNLTVTLVTDKYEINGLPYQRAQTVHFTEPTAATPLLAGKASACVARLYQPGRKYKKAWVMLTGLVPQSEVQRNLFADNENSERHHRLMECLDGINARHGQRTLIPASTGIEQPWQMKQQFLSRRYTTRWDELPDVKL
jgi:DNA polymerase V